MVENQQSIGVMPAAEFGNSKYILNPAVVHQHHATSGHYYTYTLDCGQWRCYNDEHVKDVSWEDVLRDQANVLFLFNEKCMS